MSANEVPVFASLDNTPMYIENGAAVVLDGNATVSDTELDAQAGGSGNYDGAVLKLSRSGAADPDDVFGATAGLTISGNVSLDGGVTIIGSATQADGTLQITFNANATSAAVDSVLQKLIYLNISDNPPTSVQIAYSFSDGNTGTQGTGATPGVGTGSIIVGISQVDDAPLLVSVAPSATYGIGEPGALLSPALGVFDIDATPPSSLTGLNRATITIANGFLATDQLFVKLLTDSGHFIASDGEVTNITVLNNASGTLVLVGQDTLAHWQSILAAVSYTSAAADPSNGGANPNRTITWVVNDGALNSQTPNTDPDILLNTTILHFTGPPLLDLDASAAGTGFTTTYTENSAPIRIVDTDVAISAPGSSAMGLATIILTNAKVGDSLSVEGTLGAGISVSVDTSVAGRITLTLFNPATLADYRAALGQVRFANSSDNPDATDRDIAVVVSDGETSSNTAHATVHVVPVNDPLPSVHWIRSVDIGGHPAGWLPAGIGDFNGDAVSDLAWYNSSTNGIDIWKLANGQWAGSVDTGPHPAGYQPAGFGDFNQDGTSDVLWFNATTRDAEVWKIANGQWAGSVDIGAHPAGYLPSGVGDFNGDGTSDVLWYNASTRDAEVWKISNGQWAGTVDIGTHPAGYQPSLAGDFTGDGTSDVAWYNSSNGAVDIWKISNGQWAGSVDLGAHPAGWQPLGAADFNKDGTSDIVWYNPATNDIDIWLIKNGQWAGSVDIGTHPAGAVAVGVGDFDHNGVADIMWRNTTSGSIDSWMLAFS